MEIIKRLFSPLVVIALVAFSLPLVASGYKVYDGTLLSISPLIVVWIIIVGAALWFTRG